jgi:hypothetical protein
VADLARCRRAEGSFGRFHWERRHRLWYRRRWDVIAVAALLLGAHASAEFASLPFRGLSVARVGGSGIRLRIRGSVIVRLGCMRGLFRWLVFFG